jgi:hypothetical protein
MWTVALDDPQVATSRTPTQETRAHTACALKLAAVVAESFYHRDLPAEGPGSVGPDRVTNHSEPTARRRLETNPPHRGATHRATA